MGVGNCASSLVQGVHYYRDAADDEFVPGLMHVNLGGYHVRDIEFVAAFDVDADKVGKDLSQAIVSGQNNTINFAEVPHTGVTVQRGMTHDGLGKYLSEIITKADGPTADIATILKETKADVLVSYLPVGSEEATKWYVEQALAAGVALRQLRARLHRAREVLERPLREGRASRSSATTSSRRSARRSSTASSRASSGSAASCSSAPTSSTWAATPTSSTCSSASAWSPRRSPRRTP